MIGCNHYIYYIVSLFFNAWTSLFMYMCVHVDCTHLLLLVYYLVACRHVAIALRVSVCVVSMSLSLFMLVRCYQILGTLWFMFDMRYATSNDMQYKRGKVNHIGMVYGTLGSIRYGHFDNYAYLCVHVNR